MKIRAHKPMKSTRRRLLKEIEAGGPGSQGAATIACRAFLGPNGLARYDRSPEVTFPFEVGTMNPGEGFHMLGVGVNWKDALDQAEAVAKATPWKPAVISKAVVAVGMAAARSLRTFVRNSAILMQMGKHVNQKPSVGPIRREQESLQPVPRCVICDKIISKNRKRCFAHQQIEDARLAAAQRNAEFIGATAGGAD